MAHQKRAKTRSVRKPERERLKSAIARVKGDDKVKSDVIALLDTVNVKAANSERHARTLEKANEVDTSFRLGRVQFLASLGDDFVRAETTKLLAKAWGLSLSLVEADANIAYMMICDRNDGRATRALWDREMYDGLERDKENIATVRKLIEQGGQPMRVCPRTGVEMPDAMGIQAYAIALRSTEESMQKRLDSIARANGIYDKSPIAAVQVNVNSLPEVDSFDCAEAAVFYTATDSREVTEEAVESWERVKVEVDEWVGASTGRGG